MDDTGIPGHTRPYRQHCKYVPRRRTQRQRDGFGDEQDGTFNSSGLVVREFSRSAQDCEGEREIDCSGSRLCGRNGWGDDEKGIDGQSKRNRG